MYTLIVNDFLDTQVNGIFTTQYIEQTEMLLKHNLSGARVKIVKEQNSVATFLFSMTIRVPGHTSLHFLQPTHFF